MNHIYTHAVTESALLRAKLRGIIIAGAGVALVAGLAIGAAWFWHDYASDLQRQIDEHRCAPSQIRRSMPVPEVRS